MVKLDPSGYLIKLWSARGQCHESAHLQDAKMRAIGVRRGVRLIAGAWVQGSVAPPRGKSLRAAAGWFGIGSWCISQPSAGRLSDHVCGTGGFEVTQGEHDY